MRGSTFGLSSVCECVCRCVNAAEWGGGGGGAVFARENNNLQYVSICVDL